MYLLGRFWSEVFLKIRDWQFNLNLKKNSRFKFDWKISELESKKNVRILIGDVLDIAINLERGQITQVLDQNGCLYLIQCNDRVNYDYITYEEVEHNIKKVLQEEHYNQIIENNAKNLEISNNVQSTYKFTNNILKER